MSSLGNTSEMAPYSQKTHCKDGQEQRTLCESPGDELVLTPPLKSRQHVTCEAKCRAYHGLLEGEDEGQTQQLPSRSRAPTRLQRFRDIAEAILPPSTATEIM